MTLSWQWPIPALIAVLISCALVFLITVFLGKRHDRGTTARVYSLDDDLNTETASRLFRLWRNLGNMASIALVVSLALALVLIARPSQVDHNDEHTSSRDIVLCLDVSGSTLPYDREVIDTYLQLVSQFQGERIGLSIFNSTSRTVFPLTDDYALVTTQLKAASKVLKGVQNQDDIDNMSEGDYQKISDWLDGTQNRKDATSLIGDGVVSCAAMLPGFTYATESTTATSTQRSSSIVLATDNVVSGTPTYTLKQALDVAQSAGISVDGLYSGPQESVQDAATKDMKTQIEGHSGTFFTQSNGASVDELVRQIENRKQAQAQSRSQAAVIDAPGWWVLALAVALTLWILISWRLRR
jgi:hypothetical protein